MDEQIITNRPAERNAVIVESIDDGDGGIKTLVSIECKDGWMLAGLQEMAIRVLRG